MKEWWQTRELTGLPEIPSSLKRLREKAEREGWVFRIQKLPGRGRPAIEYHVDSLPREARAALAARALAAGRGPEHDEASSLPGKRVVPGPVSPVAIVREDGGGRAAARLDLLARFEEYLSASALPVVEATLAFARLYNEGVVAVAAETRRDIPRIGGPSIRRWRRAAAKQGVGALADRYGQHRRGKGRIESDRAIQDLIVGMIADRPHVSAKHVMQGLRARFKEDRARIPAYRTVQRFLADWKARNADAYLAHTNPDAWKGRRRVAFGDAAARVERLNQLWELDSTPADVMCIDGRHALVGLVDVYSRRAMVLVSKTSRTEAILALLRRAIIAWGVPEIVKTDQGKDYTSRWMRRALDALEVRHETCPPFTPEGKPHIERFFGTMTRNLFEQLPAFTGHDVAGQQAIRARRSFAERMGGAEPVACAMTAADLQARCDQWVTGVYHEERHGSLKGMTPALAAAGWPGTVARVPNDRALDVLLAEAPGGHGIRTVGKKGIQVEATWFIAAELAAYTGQRVHVRLDAADMGRVYVFDADTSNFICVAEAPERTGADRRAIAAEARARQKSIVTDGKRELRARARAVKAHTIVDEILQGGGDDAGRVAMFPRPATEHETPALAAARDAVRPTRAAELTEDDVAAADALWDRLAAEEKPAAKIVPFAPAAGARPEFEDDESFARWVLANPDAATASDRTRLQELLKSTSFRLLLDLGPEGDKAARA